LQVRSAQPSTERRFEENAELCILGASSASAALANGAAIATANADNSQV
jgi:hypothetical protein